MAKTKTEANVARHVMRLNMDNKHHVELHEVIEGLDLNVHKSINNFIIDAVGFYIENVGKEAFANPASARYITRDELAQAMAATKNEMKKEIAAHVMSEAKSEVIRLLMGTAGGAARTQRNAWTNPDDAADSEDDETLVENALEWFDNG
jgi:hypothetical protein